MARSSNSSSGRPVLLGPEDPGRVGGVGIVRVVVDVRVMVWAMVSTNGWPSCAVRVTCLLLGADGKVKGLAKAAGKSSGMKEMARISDVHYTDSNRNDYSGHDGATSMIKPLSRRDDPMSMTSFL